MSPPRKRRLVDTPIHKKKCVHRTGNDKTRGGPCYECSTGKPRTFVPGTVPIGAPVLVYQDPNHVEPPTEKKGKSDLYSVLGARWAD